MTPNAAPDLPALLDAVRQGGVDVAAHSGKVSPGGVFVALPGSKDDGSRFVADALTRGAAFVVAEPGTVLPAGALRIQGGVDGVRRQDASLADMVFDVPYLLAYISACMTLVPGDVIYTGTPEGVSALTPGVTTRVELAGWEMPPLENPIR